MTIELEIYMDAPDTKVFQRTIDLPDDADETLILTALREAAQEWLRERK